MKKTTPLKPRLLFLLLSIGLICHSTFAQPFAIGHQNTTFNDQARNRNVDVEIYYPADTAGDDVAVTQTAGQFPVIAFGHGFVIGYDAYLYLRDLLVPQGFVLVFPKTEGGLAPSHLEFGKDLSFCLQRLKVLGADGSSIFNGRISVENAVMGHSMGGGAAFLAAGLDNQITAIATLAAAETNPSAIAAAGTLSIPSLVIAGGNDCVTPPPANQVPMYNAMQSECKTYINITGGSHCQMAASNFLCSFGELTCSPDADISRETQLATVGNYLLNWLKVQLKADCEAGTLFDNQLVSDGSISYEKTCVQCEALSVDTASDESIKVYPNPFQDVLNITLPIGMVANLSLYDMQGRKVIEQQMNGNTINLASVTRGCYLYVISGDNNIRKKGTVIKY